MEQQAYDLSVFENREEKQPRAQLRVAQADQKAGRKKDLSMLKLVSVSALVLALAWGVLYSRAQVTELTGSIDAAQTELSDSKSEYDYLSLTLESKTNLTAVENVAKTQLGMTKVDKSQITYISLETQDTVVKPAGEMKTLLSGLESGFLNLMEYIAP